MADAAWPPGEGEMPRLMRAHDWTATPLGPPDGWSEGLHAVVALMLASSQVSTLAVGPGRVLLYNDAAARLYGEHHPGALGRPLAETWPEAYASVAPLYERAFAGESVRVPAQPLDVSRTGGEVFEVYLTPVRGEDGEVAAVHMTGFEVGARVRAEAELRESEARYRLLFENMTEGFALAEMIWDEKGRPADWRYLEANEAWEQTGVPVGETVGRTAREVNPGIEPGWIETYGRVVRTGEPASYEAYAAGFGKWFETFAFRHSDNQFALLFRDVSDRKAAEAALRDSEAKFRVLFDSIDEGLAVVEMIRDEQGQIADMVFRQVNAAYERQGGVTGVVGRSIHEVVPGIEDVWLDRYKQVARTGQPLRVEDYQQDLGRWFDVYFARVDDAGRLVAIVFQDISERKRAEASLRESEAQGAFLLKLSDALRPLADPAEVQAAATTLLCDELDAGWCYYVEWNGAGTVARVLRDATREGLPSLAGEHDVSDVPEFLDLLRTGKTLDALDYASFELLSPGIRGRYAALGFRSMLGVPLVKGGRLVATLVLGDTAIRPWSDTAQALAREVAERTWAAVERARAEASLRASEERQRFRAELGDALRSLTTPAEIKAVVAERLGRHLGVDQANYYLIDGEHFVVTEEWRTAASPGLVGRHRLADFGESASTLMQADEVLRLDDARGTEGAAAFAAAGMGAGMGAVLSAPLRRDGRWAGGLHVHSAAPRAWTDEEADLLRDTGERAWAAIERARAEQALSESEARLRVLTEGIPQLVWRAGDDGLWTWASPQWTEFTGQPEEASHGWGWLATVHPDDRQEAHDAWERSKATGVFEADYRLRHAAEEPGGPDAFRWFQTRATPVRDEAGEIVEWLGTSTDVQDLREMQERQGVLVAELQHRTRNLMAVVRGVMDKTRRQSGSFETFVPTFDDRLKELARVQGLLSRLKDNGRVTFDELIRTELAAIGAIDAEGRGERVTLDGRKGMRLPSSPLQTLALALHELATNAVKYGALGQPQGHLTVRWRLQRNGGEPRLHVSWTETGVAMADPGAAPQGGGYGRELIERALPYQLGAETQYELASDGVRCTIVLPVSSTMERDDA